MSTETPKRANNGAGMRHPRLRALWLVGICGLLLSLSLNAWLYQRSEQYYRELNETRLDPIGLHAFANQPPPDPADGPLVVLYGDSRAALWPAPHMAGYQFTNRGIGGQTTAQVLARFDAHIATLHPDVVVIQVGVNDLKTIALFPEWHDAIVADCEANISEMVRRSRALGSRVILTTIFPNGEVPLERWPLWSNEIEQSIREVNRYLGSLASDGVLVLDSTPLLADSRGLLRPEYTHDFLHPNDAAYTALNEELVRQIQEKR